ncbi:hypothetical protein [Helicobacter bizzozeronii]|nr:hypothetical protein [Helicobacter bizzozeronii]
MEANFANQTFRTLEPTEGILESQEGFRVMVLKNPCRSSCLRGGKTSAL